MIPPEYKLQLSKPSRSLRASAFAKLQLEKKSTVADDVIVPHLTSDHNVDVHIPVELAGGGNRLQR